MTRGPVPGLAGRPRSPKDNRRVLVLNHFAAPSHAPGGTRHVELFSRLRGWDATILAANRNYVTRARVSERTALYRTVWTSPYCANGPGRVFNWVTYGFSAFAAGLRRPAPNVLYASSPHLLAGVAGWLLSRFHGTPFILEIRDLWPHILVEMGQLRPSSPLNNLLRRLASALYHRADAIVVMARGVESHLVKEELIPPEVVYFIPNGADPADFVAPASRNELRSRFNLQGIVVLYAGAHGPANGLDLVLDAAAELRDELPDVRFLFVGDGVAKETLMHRAKTANISNVEFRPPIPKADMPALLGAADIGLHVLADVRLFSYGVSPNKLFDYMAAGLPVITNTPGEVAAFVEEAEAGLAVSPGGLADAVRTLAAASRDEWAAMGDAGRAFMQAHRSRAALAERLGSLLDDVYSKRWVSSTGRRWGHR